MGRSVKVQDPVLALHATQGLVLSLVRAVRACDLDFLPPRPLPLEGCAPRREPLLVPHRDCGSTKTYGMILSLFAPFG